MSKAEQANTQALAKKLSANGQAEQPLFDISQPVLQNEPLTDIGVSDGIEHFNLLAEEAFLDIGGGEWLQAETLDIEQPQYVQLAENTDYAGIYQQVDAVQAVLPTAKAVEAVEIEAAATASSKSPYILIGSGLLLSGLAAASGGRSSGSADNKGVQEEKTAATANKANTDVLDTAGAAQNAETKNAVATAEKVADTAVPQNNPVAPTATETLLDQTSQKNATAEKTTEDKAVAETQADKTVTEPSVADNTVAEKQNQDVAAVTQPVSDGRESNQTATEAVETNSPNTPDTSEEERGASVSDGIEQAADKSADSGVTPSEQAETSSADTTENTDAAVVLEAESKVVAEEQAETVETETAANTTAETTGTTISDGTAASPATVADISNNKVTVSPTAKESGLTLDIAKHFYSADVIKQYIDVISTAGGTYLQLHLSDNENYAFESKVLNQLASNATLNSDGTYTNNATGKQFLSFEQIADIAAYAKAKGVELIPEVDTPNHMDAIFKLLELYQGSDYVAQLKSKVVDNEIDITSDASIAFVQSLYSEVIGLMGGSSRHFHIGGDEFGYSADNNYEFISYANEMAAFLETQGLTTRMWNDGILKTSLAVLDKNIEITYWSHDGNTTDTAAAVERREERAGMDDLLDSGFDVLNYNWYYLYFVPTDSSSAAESGSHMASDIQSKWELGLWDGTGGSTITDTGNIIGASLTIWGEYATSMTDDEIFAASKQSLTALINKVNSLSVDTGTLSAYTLELSADTAVNEVIELDSQLSSLVNISMTSEISESGNSFVWLNGNSGDIINLTSDWVASGTSELKDNVSYTLYKSGQNHLYIDTDIVVAQV